MEEEVCKSLGRAHLGLRETEFLENVARDIEAFVKRHDGNRVLLFPPLNNYYRLIIHKTCDTYSQERELATFSVGQGEERRTVLCYKKQLLNPGAYEAFKSQVPRKPPRPKRRERRNSEDIAGFWTQPSSSAKSSGKMGVEKQLADARPTKSVDLYRPPALRHLNSTEASEPAGADCGQRVSTTTTNTTAAARAVSSTSPQNGPSNGTENSSFDDSLTSSNASGISDDQTISVPMRSQQRQQSTRRERRPDREVYVPRARRSQTTPPTAQQATTATTATAAGNGNRQLPITADSTALVTEAPSSRADEPGIGSVKSASKKSKHQQRKERIKKDLPISTQIDKPSVPVAIRNGVSPERSNSKARTNPCDTVYKPAVATAEINIAYERTSDHFGPVEAPKSPPQFDTTHKMDNANNLQDPAILVSGAVNKTPALRIEDVAGPHDKARKCDIEEQELQRASKEINRSNRRIIKQTFVSDVLEIPDKIDDDVHDEGKRILKPVKSTLSANSSLVDSTTEEEEDDDWESMFDESGDCLDPKVIEDLTASVGKVKIALPQMDYTAYLTKQSILNEEEYPHVLEVSNFPVEFKNQDLMMVFSQYKESGFDIKWVDDTHALAVFSSSRIAAEVLTMGHPFVVLKPLAEATVESRLKAKKCAASLQPYRARPETCIALARRLVTGALGVRLKTAAAEREDEKRVLRAAKERKLLAAKQRDEAWES